MLKNAIVGILNKIFNVPQEQRFRKLAPLFDSGNRESRKHDRKIWKLFRINDMFRNSIGCPLLSGDRRLRTISNIYGISLPTVKMLSVNGILEERIEDERSRRRIASLA